MSTHVPLYTARSMQDHSIQGASFSGNHMYVARGPPVHPHGRAVVRGTVPLMQTSTAHSTPRRPGSRPLMESRTTTEVHERVQQPALVQQAATAITSTQTLPGSHMQTSRWASPPRQGPKLAQPASVRLESPQVSPQSPRRVATGPNTLTKRHFIAWDAADAGPAVRTVTPEHSSSQILDVMEKMPKDIQPADSPIVTPSSCFSPVSPCCRQQLTTPPPEEVPPWRSSSVKRQSPSGSTCTGGLDFPRTPSFHSIVAGQRSGGPVTGPEFPELLLELQHDDEGTEFSSMPRTPPSKDSRPSMEVRELRAAFDLENSRLEEELAEVRAELAREVEERKRVAAELETVKEEQGQQGEQAREQAADIESREKAAREELKETQKQRDALRKQLKDKTEKYCELVRKLRKEQGLARGLEADIAKSGIIRQNLESQVKHEHMGRISAELLAKELQMKVQKYETAEVVKPATSSNLPCDLQERLRQLREQLEATESIVHSKFESFDSNTLSGSGLTQTNTGISGIDGSPASSPQCVEPPSSAMQTPGSTATDEEELPTDERLIGDWSDAYEEDNNHDLIDEDAQLEQIEPGTACGQQMPDQNNPGQQASSNALQHSEDHVFPANVGDGAYETIASPEGQTRPLETEIAPLSPGKDPGREICISLRGLSEIKTLKKPPRAVQMLMEVCCLLFAIQPHKQVDGKNSKKFNYDYWEPARRQLLSDPFFLSKLRKYDPQDITPQMRAKIQKYFRSPEFNEERLRSCSKAAHELYRWVELLLRPPEVGEGEDSKCKEFQRSLTC